MVRQRNVSAVARTVQMAKLEELRMMKMKLQCEMEQVPFTITA